MGGEIFKMLLDFLNFRTYVPTEKLGEMDSKADFYKLIFVEFFDPCGFPTHKA